MIATFIMTSITSSQNNFIKPTSYIGSNMKNKKLAVVYCEGFFGKMDGKTANGLARHSDKYEIAGIIDSTKANLDAGEILDNTANGIRIYKDIHEALKGKRRFGKSIHIWNGPFVWFLFFKRPRCNVFCDGEKTRHH